MIQYNEHETVLWLSNRPLYPHLSKPRVYSSFTNSHLHDSAKQIQCRAWSVLSQTHLRPQATWTHWLHHFKNIDPISALFLLLSAGYSLETWKLSQAPDSWESQRHLIHDLVILPVPPLSVVVCVHCGHKQAFAEWRPCFVYSWKPLLEKQWFNNLFWVWPNVSLQRRWWAQW